MDDLVSWLREQIAEDEEAARDAGGCRWQRDGISCVEDADNRSLVVYGEGTPSQEEADHIARHDPAAVLAQCEAHTMLLDSITARLGDADRLEQMGAQPADVSAIRAPAEWQLAVTALTYQHRPGYQEAWRP